ncbi:MAG: hypothetical protein ACXWLH_05675 [Candidatus Saccharimonadales bacterium]
MTKHQVIYVPGIQDDIYKIQSLALKTWWLYGIKVQLYEMPWAGAESFEPKLQKLLDLVDKYAESGKTVTLIGPSAGASAVLNAYVERKDKIHRVILIAAKINGPETVSDRTYDENPAFKTSLYLLQNNLKKLTTKDKAKIVSFWSPGDGYVPFEATTIPGVREEKLPSFKHGYSIFYSITLKAKKIAGLIK